MKKEAETRTRMESSPPPLMHRSKKKVNLILSMQGEVQAGDVIELQARVQGDQQLYQETPISRHHPDTDLALYKSIIDMKHNVPQLRENFGIVA